MDEEVATCCRQTGHEAAANTLGLMWSAELAGLVARCLSNCTLAELTERWNACCGEYGRMRANVIRRAMDTSCDRDTLVTWMTVMDASLDRGKLMRVRSITESRARTGRERTFRRVRRA